jgi:hypothetical protein
MCCNSSSLYPPKSLSPSAIVIPAGTLTTRPTPLPLSPLAHSVARGAVNPSQPKITSLRSSEECR